MNDNKKILVVDDDESILDAITLVLEEDGYKVQAIDNGEEMFRRIRTFKPDLILLDVLMSGVDGRVICKKLKQQKTTKNIPVVMISAHPSAQKGAKDSGAEDFIAKPFATDDLLTTIKHHINPTNNYRDILHKNS